MRSEVRATEDRPSTTIIKKLKALSDHFVATWAQSRAESCANVDAKRARYTRTSQNVTSVVINHEQSRWTNSLEQDSASGALVAILGVQLLHVQPLLQLLNQQTNVSYIYSSKPLKLKPTRGQHSPFTSPVMFLSSFLFTLSSSLFLPFTVIPSMGMFPVENRRHGNDPTKKQQQNHWWFKSNNVSLCFQ